MRSVTCVLIGVLFGACCAVLSFAVAAAVVGPHARYHSRPALPIHLANSPAIIDVSADGFRRGSMPFERVLGLMPGELVVAVDGEATPGHFLDVQIAGRGTRRALVLVHR